jgi:hypothetical protein
MRRLRVLSDHPHLGRPGDIRSGFEGAQAYVDAGLAEWIVDRAADVETTDRAGAPETAVERPPVRKRIPPATETR